MDKHHTQLSKFLSLVLRHQPEAAGIQLDANGWVETGILLAGCRAHGMPISEDELTFVVENNDKRRFAFSPDGKKIRASQGHSCSVDLGYPPSVPPEVLFHGTARENLESIRRSGLSRRSRHHVHLSADPATAVNVGRRHGPPMVLKIRATDMAAEGHLFYRSENGVWLTESVSPGFIEFPED